MKSSNPDTPPKPPGVPRPRGASQSYLHPGTDATLRAGLSDAWALAAGLTLRRTDARDLQGAAMRAVLPRGVWILLVVGGEVDLDVAGRRLRLGPREGSHACGAVIPAAEPLACRRQSRRGDVERSVELVLEDGWLRDRLGDEALACLAAQCGSHAAPRPWNASARCRALVGQMLQPPALEPALWALYLESRALDLAVEALDSLSGGAPAHHDAVPGRRDLARMAQVRDLLDSGRADALTLEQIAQRACLSVNTLQRHFRAAWGMTVFAYLRETRLQRARLALERDGVSVSHAAWIAGYASQANFATAFRRRYGMQPGQARGRA